MTRPPLFTGKSTLRDITLNAPMDLLDRGRADGCNFSELFRDALVQKYGNGGRTEETLAELESKGRALLEQAAAIRAEVGAKQRVEQEGLQRELELKNLEAYYADLQKHDRALVNKAYSQLKAEDPNFRTQGRAAMLRKLISKVEELGKSEVK